MLDAPAIIDRLASDIRCAYDRPLMHGGTAEGVGLVIHNLQTTLAACLEVEEKYRAAVATLSEREGHQAMSCAGYLASIRPSATEEEKAAYVVSFYKRLDASLGLTTTPNASGKPKPTVTMDS